jgi:hypothetical protein
MQLIIIGSSDPIYVLDIDNDTEPDSMKIHPSSHIAQGYLHQVNAIYAYI